MAQFKAVIFDLDGTLLNSIGDIAAACNWLLDREGLPVYSTMEYRKWVGAGMKNLLTQALPPEQQTAQTIAALLPRLQERYHQNCTEKSYLYPGIEEMLAGIESLGIPKAILSNKPDEITQVCVGHFLQNYHFTPIFGQRGGHLRKPHPGSGQEIARILQVLPDEVLYIGDTAIDMETASNAGFYPFGVAWGFRPEELSKAGALTIGKKPEDILTLLESPLNFS